MPRCRGGPLSALRLLLLAGLLLGAARAGAPAEITGFVSGASPGASWSTGYGGLLTITLFNIVGGELEGAWQGGELSETSILTFSAKAYLGPSIGRVVPYVGLGAGVYRESIPGGSDTGTLGSVFVGAKLKFPFGLVVRGELQWLDLPMAAPVDLDERYFLGLGLSF